MFRYLMVTVVVLFTTAAVQAESIRGVVKSVDANKITVTVGSQDRTLELAKNVSVYGNFVQGLLPRRQVVVSMQLQDGMNAVRVNMPVLLTTVPGGGLEQVTEIRLEGTMGRRR